MIPAATFFAITTVVAIIMHLKKKRLVFASAMAAIISWLMYLTIGGIIIGHFDPYFHFYIIYLLPLTFAVSAAVGAPIAIYRNTSKEKGKKRGRESN